jgi:hypothetical protein
MTRALAHALRPTQSKARPRPVTGLESTHPSAGALSAWSFSSVPVVQPALKVGRSDDPLEHAADRVAGRVASGGAVEHAKTCGCGGTCPQCRAAKLQRSARSAGPVAAAGTGPVGAPLASSGLPLSAGVRSFFEPRLGADLSHVRVHTGSEAARSADALDARAYAVGRDVVFGAGEFRPESAAGRRLLAHELTHVLQQEEVGTRIQRDDKDKPARIDIAVVLDGDAESMRAAQALAPKVVRVYDPSDIKTALTGAGGAIRTLYVVSHSNAAGELKFESSIGTIHWKKLSDISAELKGALPSDKAPQVVDFRGCKLGEATEELGRFKQAAGAGSVKASNCWTFDTVVGPITLDGVDITSESQLTPQNTANFETGLRRLINSVKTGDGRVIKDCILGLGPGESADRNLAKIKSQYFAGKGSITGEWASPEYNQNWQAGSKCFKDLTGTSTPCAVKTAMNEPAAGADDTRVAAAEPEPGSRVEAGSGAPAATSEEAVA